MNKKLPPSMQVINLTDIGKHLGIAPAAIIKEARDLGIDISLYLRQLSYQIHVEKTLREQFKTFPADTPLTFMLSVFTLGLGKTAKRIPDMTDDQVLAEITRLIKGTKQ